MTQTPVDRTPAPAPGAATVGVLGIEVARDGEGRATVTLSGRFDVVEAQRVRECFAGAGVAEVDHLVVDLSRVGFVDSAGLAALARARRDRALRGGTVALVRPRSEDAMRVFRLTQFDRIFTFVEPRRPDPVR